QLARTFALTDNCSSINKDREIGQPPYHTSFSLILNSDCARSALKPPPFVPISLPTPSSFPISLVHTCTARLLVCSLVKSCCFLPALGRSIVS
ncbi:unnamed protein product, partial [Hymenolepis diminuta]